MTIEIYCYPDDIFTRSNVYFLFKWSEKQIKTVSFTFFVSILYSAGTLAGISSCFKVVFHSVKISAGAESYA